MFEKHIGKYLSIAKRAHSMFLQKKLKTYNIGRGELFILIALYKKDAICQQTLCEYYKLNKAAVGRAVKKLKKKKYIIKKIDKNDKRKMVLFLTKKAKNMKSEFVKILNSVEKTVKKNLTEKEINEFIKISEKISKNIHEAID